VKGQALEIEHVADGVVSLRIATNENPYIEASFISALAKRVQELGADAGVRAIVVEGDSQYFSAGASREALLANDPEAALLPKIAQIPRLVLSLPVPTIAAMAGHAIGGGFLTGLWCDIVVLAEESLYGMNAIELGLTPVMGSSVILEEVLGALLARELLFAGRMVTGHEIKEWGGPLAHNVVPRAQVRERAYSIARDIADKPQKAVSLYKRALSAKRQAVLEQAIVVEKELYGRLANGDEMLALIAEHYPVAYAQSGDGNRSES
jgi:polyketide biosynthesis enoyl-CoA hydratase PksI